MPCVFISHSSLDRELVEREIMAPLRAHGVDTWYSTDDIQTASEWERQIREGLVACDWFLVALSPRAVESEWVMREVHWAVLKRKGRIVPVMLETCEPEDLHLGLLPIQYIDFRGGDERALERLLAVWGLDKGTQVRGLYQAAHEAMAKEDWASAAEKLEAVLRLDPAHSQSVTDLDHVRRQEYLASLYQESGTAVQEKRWGDALETLGRLREASADYKDVEELIAVARAGLENEEAERLYGEATEAALREEWAAAVEKFRAALEIAPSHAGAQSGFNRAARQRELAELYAAGLANLEGGRWLEALKTFRRVRSIDRSYKDVAELIADADAALADEEDERAKKERQERKEADSQRAHARNRTALWGRRGAVGNGMRGGSLTRVLKGLPDALEHKLELLKWKYWVVVAGLIVITALSVAVLNWWSAESHAGKGHALFQQMKYAEAEAEYSMAVAMWPSGAGYHNSLAASLYRQKKYEEAEAEYRKAIELDPNNESYHFDLGELLLERGRNPEAEGEYRKGIELNANNAGSHYHLGIALGLQQIYEAAEAECATAVALQPDSADYHYAHAISLFSLDRHEEAAVEFRNAISLNPNKADYHDRLGFALSEQHKYGEAADEFGKASELAPDYAAYHNNLGFALEQQGNHKDADAQFRKAILLQPDSILYHTNLAITLHGEDKHKEEKEEYERVLQIDPNSMTAKQYLIRKKSTPLNLAIRLQG